MRKIVFALLFAVCATVASPLFAQQPMDQQQPPANGGGGMLKVRLADETPVSISIDGRYFGRHGRSLTIGGLPEGRHYLKIYARTPGRRMGSNGLIFEGKVNISQGEMTVFALNPYTGETNITAQGINQQAYGRPNYEDYGAGGAQDQGSYPDNNGYAQNNGNMPPPNNGYNGNDQNNGNMPPPNGYNNGQQNNNPPDNYNQNNYSQNNGNTPPPNGYNDNNNQGNTNNNNNYSGNGNYRYGGHYNDGNGYNQPPATPPQSPAQTSIDQPYLDKLKVKSDNKITDTEKLKLLEAALKSETISTAQVSAIMGWLNFENSRVLFAKWAYDVTVDKANYQILENQFSYQNSRNELDDYINKK